MAQLSRIGLLMTSALGSAGSVVSSTYAPLAWNMNQDFSLEWAATTIAASPRGIFAMLIRGNGSDASGTGVPDNRGYFNKIIAGSNNVSGTVDAEHAPGWDFVNDNSAGNNGGGVFRSNGTDGNGVTNSDANHSIQGNYSAPVNNGHNSKWLHVLAGWDTSGVLSSKIGAVYFNGVKIASMTETGSWGGGNLGYQLSKWMLNAFNTGAGGIQAGDFDCAQVYFDTPASLAGIMSGTNTSSIFTASTLKKFYDVGGAGIVDYGVDGSTPTGTQPLIFLDIRPGGAATDILVNRGTLVAPTVSAFSGTTFASYKKPYLASLHPGETTSGPYRLWGPTTSSNAVGNTGSYSGFNNLGQPIAQNDKIVVILKWTINTGDVHPSSISVASVNDGSYTQVGSTATWNQGTTAIFAVDAGASSVTAPGATWTANTKPTVTFTAGTAPQQVTAYVMVFRNPTGTACTITGGTPGVGSGTTATLTANSVTAPAGKGTWVDLLFAYDWSFEGNITPPAAKQLVWKRGGNGAGTWPFVWEQRISNVSPTATGTSAYTNSSATSNGFGAVSFTVIA